MQEIWNLILYNYVGILVVFARVMGIFIFNPIMGRSTVPMRVRVAMTLVLTMAMLAHLSGGSDLIGYVPTSIPGFVGVLILEALVGFIFGFIVNMILNVIILAGKIIDNQITIALAEVMDPTTGVTMPIMANLYYYLFVLYFFLVGGHLSYISLFARSYRIVPIGFSLSLEWIGMAGDIVDFLGVVFTLALKMAMPIIAAEMILQICVGVIMKAVPSIQIFVINIQMKILMGLFIIMAIAGPMSDFIERLMGIMFENLYGTLERMG
ncbi:MAG: flagellar biosynthetic protein FliR [Oscillospiraceae bacterium]|nr:flagellar biosynthetic protein FliR [Oscillospiraceae bacterium]